MWEDLAVVLAGAGFALATALLMIELPGVLRPSTDRRAARAPRFLSPPLGRPVRGGLTVGDSAGIARSSRSGRPAGAIVSRARATDR